MCGTKRRLLVGRTGGRLLVLVVRTGGRLLVLVVRTSGRLLVGCSTEAIVHWHLWRRVEVLLLRRLAPHLSCSSAVDWLGLRALHNIGERLSTVFTL